MNLFTHYGFERLVVYFLCGKISTEIYQNLILKISRLKLKVSFSKLNYFAN